MPIPPEWFDGYRCLVFERVAPGCAYHAALIATDGPRARGLQVTEHTQDYYEMVFVLAGEAIHSVNGRSAPLQPGSLHVLRPGDWHFVRYQAGRLLHYINIALPAGLWETFRDLTGTGEPMDKTLSSGPVMTTLATAPAGDCAGAFRHALEQFQTTPARSPVLRLEACRLLGTVLPHLFTAAMGEETGEVFLPRDAPPWLVGACSTLQNDTDALREGLPRFIAESGVSGTHLARVLKSVLHQTPTQYINALRLERAARLLTTTTVSILDIVGECGFDQPSYFYRLFHARFQVSPHAYRIAAGRRVVPRSAGPRPAPVSQE